MKLLAKIGMASFAVLMAAVGLVGAAQWRIATGSANPLSRHEGDLRLADTTLGEKKFDLVASSDLVFDETDEFILFGRWDDYSAESETVGGAILKMMRRDGTDERSLAEVAVVEARFDRVGERVYYVTAGRDLYSVDVDGGGRRRLQGKVLSFDVSPDGTRVVYQKLNPDWQPGDYYDRALGLTVLDLKSGTEKSISRSWEDFGPIWTPDGRNVLFFSRDAAGAQSHFIVGADGFGRRGLKAPAGVRMPVPSERPIWSADGRRLIYESDRSIWLNEFDDTFSRLNSAKKLGFGKHPRWTDDGRAVRVLVGDYGDFSPASTVTLDLDGKIIK